MVMVMMMMLMTPTKTILTTTLTMKKKSLVETNIELLEKDDQRIQLLRAVWSFGFNIPEMFNPCDGAILLGLGTRPHSRNSR